MQSFSISNMDGEHLGFLVMDMEYTHQTSGTLMIKVQTAETFMIGQPETLALQELANMAKNWQIQEQEVIISDDENDPCARVRGEYLSFRRYTYRLNDLTGVC
ncbi:MAG: hypothetical protein J6V99_02865 [Neisseriaceae bacterium]|nr:hypothetical protein [Neisseriaceae bacterium]